MSNWINEILFSLLVPHWSKTILSEFSGKSLPGFPCHKELLYHSRLIKHAMNADSLHVPTSEIEKIPKPSEMIH